MSFKKKNFNKVIIWGHPLHSHTHSYIHYAFYRAFKHLGYNTLWLDETSDISNEDFSNCLFLTEGQVQNKMPVREDCSYILHNPTADTLPDSKVTIQVFVSEVLNRNVTEVSDGVYVDEGQKLLYFPWGTDLLPHEFPFPLEGLPQKQVVNWVGTVGGGLFGNEGELNPFINRCNANKIQFQKYFKISVEENIRLIRESCLAPAIVGTWQKEQGYIPCRIFKNISYGNYGITNSEAAQNLFKGRLVYKKNTAELFDAAMEELPRQDNAELLRYVREKHTYLNRIKWILEML